MDVVTALRLARQWARTPYGAAVISDHLHDLFNEPWWRWGPGLPPGSLPSWKRGIWQ